ncbi:NAD(P)H-dependent oxidoreductase [Lacticaseibacillus hulanensis]|uniref:NAD(P)H-dependent oxidoreductase n=1 Tax=Lacticaseibacillus hulanensis TaxID=2493111 RepID=UPI0013E3DC82|nr:NAD(P)H-dependent oxidoreductase [Lacticaseibacillus hulanensis]
MQTLIVVAHPNIARSNTQSFFKETAAQVPESTWHELTDCDYSPAEVASEQALILAADRIVLQFPLYWYSAPAQLWAWLDAVWQRGVVYDDTGGLLRGKELAVVVSFSHPLTDYRLGARENVTVDTLLAPFAAIARKTGMTMLTPLLVPEFARMTEQARAELFTVYQQYLTLDQPTSRRKQAQWFEAELAKRGDALLADTMSDINADMTQLHQTVADLRTGEVD